MKKIQFILSLYFILILFDVNAQWQPSPGPYGGRVSAITTCNNFIFAGGNGGVFISSDNGINWQAINTGFPVGIYVNAFAVNGTTIYAGTNQGVYKSINNGSSWTEVNNGLNKINVLSLTVNGLNIFAGTYYGGVYSTSNAGTLWTQVITNLKLTEVTALASIGSNVFAGTWGGGIYTTSTAGSTWATANTSIPSNAALGIKVITSLVANGTTLYASVYENGVYKSTNNGTSWTAVNTGLTNLKVLSLATDGTNVFAGTNGGGVFLTTNAGTGWTAVNTGLASVNSKYILSLACINGKVFAGTREGIYASSNNGTNWSVSNNGLSCLEITSIITANSKVFVASDNGIFTRSDTDTAWFQADSGLTTLNSQYISSLKATSNKIYASTYGGMYVSSNYGVSWTAINTGLTSTDMYSVTANANMIYAGSNDSLFLSANGGSNWIGINNGITMSSVNALALYGNNVYAATAKGVYVSLDNGATWAASNNGFPENTCVNALVINGSLLYAGTDQGVFVSNNNAASWTAINTGLTTLQVISLYHNGTNLIAGTYGDGVYVYLNNSASWVPANVGLPANLSVNSLTVNNNYLYIATENGIWKRSLSDLLKPYNAGAITGDTIICKGTFNLYTVPKIVSATSYIWEYPTGFTVLVDSNVLIVYIDTNAVSGTITVHGQNSSGNGDSSSLFVYVNPVVDTPSAITGPVEVCGVMTNVIYSVSPIANASSYVWSSLNPNPDTTNSNVFSLNLNTTEPTAVIKVKGFNKCSEGPEVSLPITIHQTFNVSTTKALCPGQSINFGGFNFSLPGIYTHTFVSSIGCDSNVTLTITAASVPTTPTAIVGPTYACKGQTDIVYKTTPVANTTSYLWTLPYGITGSSTADSILVNIGNNAISGNIKVYAQNTCGNSTASIKAVAVNAALPDASGTITSTAAFGGDTVCSGQNNVAYTVAAIANAATYSWIYSGTGVTINGTSNNITVNFSDTATSGDLIVYGSNSCGDGIPSANFNITILNCTGINEYSTNNGYKLFPNPATNEANITFPEQKKEAMLTVYNVLGQNVHQENIAKGTTHIKINTQQYPSGIYKVVVNEKGSIKAMLNLVKQ